MEHLFYDDYSEGAHPEILAAIADANGGQQRGYGNDELCAAGAEAINRTFGVDADVHFLSTGTLANIVGLSSALRSFEGVIAPTSGHISTHETGAIEATGHKVITVDSPTGKLTPELIDRAMRTHEDEHTVRPRVAYLSHAADLGTVYAQAELEAVVARARHHGLLVFVDGARLAMALASDVAGMTPESLVAAGVDMFTVGGTKAGGMFGDALVVANPALRPDLRYSIKQRGGLLAKGRFVGAQFARFFADDGLWLEIGRLANGAAERLAKGLHDLGVEMPNAREVNQVFAVLPNPTVAKVSERFGFYEWEAIDHERTLVRFVCSWATSDDNVDALLDAVGEALQLA